jgi:hypothetical protein
MKYAVLGWQLEGCEEETKISVPAVPAVPTVPTVPAVPAVLAVLKGPFKW